MKELPLVVLKWRPTALQATGAVAKLAAKASCKAYVTELGCTTGGGEATAEAHSNTRAEELDSRTLTEADAKLQQMHTAARTQKS